VQASELRFGGFDAWSEHAAAQTWSDGLPAVPPTGEWLDEALRTVGAPQDAVLGRPPGGDEVSVGDAAWYAALAGCQPEYLPVVVAAVRAFFGHIEAREAACVGIADCSHALIVNGPARRELGVNCGLGLLGPGWRANATIGRALELLVRDRFGGVASFGDPAQYTLCFGEDEEGSAWTPLHVQRGLEAEQSAVTVLSVAAAKSFLDRRSTEPAPLLDSAAAFLRGPASPARWFPEEPVAAALLLGAESRRRIVDGGWDKADVAAHLTAALGAPGGPGQVPVRLRSAGDLLVIAGGGPAFAACFWLVSYGAPPVTMPIERAGDSR
jgi:hypothetical protein